MADIGHRVVFTAAERVAVEQFRVEQPQDYEVLVRTERSLISAGTELTNLLGQLSVFRGYPVYPGYSNVGVVEATGALVKQPVEGTRVLTMGRHTSHFKIDLSPERPGGPEYWEKVPDSIPSEQASFAVLASVALHGVRKANLEIGQSVVVVGAGVVGQLVAQFARWSGCQPLIVSDLFEQRLEIARQSGADVTVNARTDDALTVVAESTNGRGADVVFEGTRSAKTLPLMMELAAQSGRLMVVGSLPGSVEIDPFTHLQLKELSVIGCFQPAAPLEEHAYFPWTQQRNRKVFLDMVESGKLSVEHLISHRLPYTSASEAYAMIKEHGESCMGVVFEW